MTKIIGAGNKSVLAEEALSLFDNGAKILLTNPDTGQAIIPYSERNPIRDREHLEEMCHEHPNVNLEIMVGKAEGLIALIVNQGIYAQNGFSSFDRLCEEHGDPDTIGYIAPSRETQAGVMPDEHVHLFHYDVDSFEVGERSGLRLVTTTETLSVYPSIVGGQQVEKIGSATTVQSLSAWIGGSVSPGDIPQSAEPEVKMVGMEKVSGPEPTEAPAPDATGIDVPFEEKTDTHIAIPVGESLKQESAVSANPVETLREEIRKGITGGADKSKTLRMALDWNQDSGIPVKVEDVIALVDELGGTAPVEVEALAGEELLFKLAEQTILFHDGLGDPYFHFEGVPFKAPSKDFAGRIQNRYYNKTRVMPKAKELNNVMSVLQSKAKYEGPRIILENRVSDKDGAIVYDLRDNRYLKVTDKGWEIIPSFPLFYRHKHQQAQLEPVAGGDPWKVFEFLPVEEEHRLLVMVYLISLFVPRIAHPVLAVFGDQGSAKSCFCTIINKLVDPTLTEKVILPKNERDLIQTLRLKYVTVLDNLSRINDRVSDIFCQVCTGASISYRTLYTDEGENIAQFRHVIILNSISLAIANADLMDRSIILKCHRIKSEDRRPEDELWDAFEAARAGILGGIFDALVKAKTIYPTIKIDKLPRLADFAKWGYAIAEALGQSGEKFIEDFSQNVRRQNESVAEKNVLCQAMLQLMSDKDDFLKSVGDAHSALKNIAGADAKDESFPKLPHNLRGGLEKLRSTLAEHNITFQFFERVGSGIRVLFSKSASPDASMVADSGEAQQETCRSVPDVADEPEGKIPVIEFEEIPEVINA